MERLRQAAGSLYARVAVTAGLLALVAFQVDWGKAADRVSAGQWGWFVAAVGVLVASLVVGAIRWDAFLRGAAVPATLGQAMRAYFIGIFSNNFLPTGFGGDAARAWIIGRTGEAPLRAAVSVLADRGSSLACGFVLAWVALAADPGSVPSSLVLALAGASAAGLLGAALLVVALRGAGPLARRLPDRVRGWARQGRATLIGYARNRRLLGSALALGLVFQVLGVGGFWLASKTIGAGIPFSLMAVAVPLVLVITVLPISLAGFGVREGSFVVLLGEAGISATNATVVSLLSVAALALASLPGAFAMLRSAPEGAAGIGDQRAA